MENFSKSKKFKILLLDSALYNPDEEQMVSGKIKVYFLPPNATSLLLVQPLDQAVFENFKRNYRKKLIEGLKEQRVTECLKQVILKDIAY